jgi:hypothetical protein
MSNFVLAKLCELIKSGVRTDMGFKKVHQPLIRLFLGIVEGMLALLKCTTTRGCGG